MSQTPKFDLAIIGLGYVGLPLGLQFAKSGCRVLGLDIDPAKIKEIEARRSIYPVYSGRRCRYAGEDGMAQIAS